MGAEVLGSRAIKGMFYELLEESPIRAEVEALSFDGSSDQDSETYNWLGMVPGLREWAGGRQAKGLRDNGIEITNRHFEATLEFTLKELRRDKTKQIRVRIGELADRVQDHWLSLLSTLVNNGESGLCYDGQAFFSASHSEGSSGTLKNLLAAGDDAVYNVTTPANPTAEELVNCTMRAIQQFYAFKDDQGEPINQNARSFLVMVPTNMLANAATAFQTKLLNGATGSKDNPINVGKFSVDYLVNPRLTATTKFQVFRTDGRLKPFIRQQEDGTEPVLKAIAEDSELEFTKSVHWYGIDTWRNVGYGMWQYAVSCELS